VIGVVAEVLVLVVKIVFCMNGACQGDRTITSIQMFQHLYLLNEDHSYSS